MMNLSDAHQSVIYKALERILRPLVRILIHNGVTFIAFSDLAKQIYIDVADSHFKVENRKQTHSRISTLTGLSRKDVQKMRGEKNTEFTLDTYFNRAAKVVYGWAHDEAFQHDGKPAVLTLNADDDPSFVELVKKYSGDIPVGAILDELVRAGIVERQENEVKLLTLVYVPTRSDTAKLHLLGIDVAALLHTFHHNIYEETAPLMQRKVRFNNLPLEQLMELKSALSESGQEFLKQCSETIAQYDRGGEQMDGQRKEVGVGIYYFEKEIISEEQAK